MQNKNNSKIGGWIKQKVYELVNGGGYFSQGLYGEVRAPLNGVALSGMRLSMDSLFTVWRNHGDVFACVRELKNNVGSEGYMWVNTVDPNKDPNPASVKKVEEILNFKGSFRSKKNKIIQYEQISGNGYFLLVHGSDSNRTPLGLDVIDPRTLSVVVDQFGNVYKWIQTYKGETQDYGPDEVLQFKENDDPNSPIFGLSPLEPIIWEARTDLSAMISNFAFFANDAQPGAQYILEDGISDDQREKTIEDIKRQLQGPENRNRSVTLVGVKEVKTLQFTQKDMEFLQGRNFATEKICAAFGVPKSVLNYTDKVNYSNGENQMQKFWEGTITPLQNLFAEFLNQNLLPKLGIADIKLEYKSKTFDDVQWAEASSRADLTAGVLTINEVREKRDQTPFDPSIYGEFVDKPLLYNGASVKPLEDIGIDMMPDGTPAILSNDQATKEIEKIDRMARRSRIMDEPTKQELTDKDIEVLAETILTNKKGL